MVVVVAVAVNTVVTVTVSVNVHCGLEKFVPPPPQNKAV